MSQNKKHSNPPKLAQRFLLWFLKGDLAEEVLGDLDEKFELISQKHSPYKAKKNYWYQVLHYLRPFAIRLLWSKYSNPFIMFKHNLLISYRSFLRFKSTFLINLIGLSSGLACTLLIYLWVADELSINNFHEKDSRLFQVFQNDVNGDDIMTAPYMPGRMSRALKADYPEVEHASMVIPPSFFTDGGVVKTGEGDPIKAREQYVENDFLHIFSFPLLQGDINSALIDKRNVVISESLARSLFNRTDDVIGEVVSWEEGQIKGDFIISGVIADVPANSTMRFNILLNYELFMDRYKYMEDWGNSNPSAFLTLKEGSDAEAFNLKIADIKKKRVEKTKSVFFIQQYSDHYLHGLFENGQIVGGRILYVRLFSGIALLILLIACINFMNLSTAKATGRLKEIGVKKAMGAKRASLIAQYFTESTLLAFVGLFLAIGMTALFLPQFEALTDKQLSLEFNGLLLLSIPLIVIGTGFLAGIYPALYLSSFGTLQSLKGKLSRHFGDVWARKGLVVFQFFISIVLISSVLITSRQMDYIQSKNLGYNRDNVFYFSNNGIPEERYEAFLAALREIPGVSKAFTTSHDLAGKHGRTSGIYWTGKRPDQDFDFINLEMGPGFAEGMEIELLMGRYYDHNRPNEEQKIMFNETAIRMMGMEDPIGKKIKLWGREKEIIGVVKDFHANSLFEKIEPTFMQAYSVLDRTAIRVNTTEHKDAMEQIQAISKEFGNALPLEFRYIEQDYLRMYESEQRVTSLSSYFSVIAILISCLGLLGLTAYTVERRSKEMSIRKVLGSGAWRIVKLLSADFTRMVLISLLIGLPTSYFIAQNWLNDFEFRIDLEWWNFLLAGLLIWGVASMTVGYLAVKAAKANPAEGLRSE